MCWTTQAVSASQTLFRLPHLLTAMYTNAYVRTKVYQLPQATTNKDTKVTYIHKQSVQRVVHKKSIKWLHVITLLLLFWLVALLGSFFLLGCAGTASKRWEQRSTTQWENLQRWAPPSILTQRLLDEWLQGQEQSLSLPLCRCCISEGCIASFKVCEKDAWSRCPKMPPKRSPDQSEPDQLDDLADCKAPPAMDPQGGCRQGMESTDLRKHCSREQRSTRCHRDLRGATRANWPHQKPKRGYSLVGFLDLETASNRRDDLCDQTCGNWLRILAHHAKSVDFQKCTITQCLTANT